MVMRRHGARRLILVYSLATVAACSPAADSLTHLRVTSEMSAAPAGAEGTEPGDAPRQVLEVWLRYHETEVCQDADAVFVFNPKGVEVWCEAADEKGCQKLVDMFSGLKAAYEIDFYVTRPTPARKREDEKNPPPSLWNNAELLRYLKDPFGSSMAADSNVARRDVESRHDEMLKQRLLMYAEQVQDWNQRLKRCGVEIPALARAGFGTEFPQDLKKRAVLVCMAHVQTLDKYAARLNDALQQALPRPARNSGDKSKSGTFHKKGTPVEIAAQLSAATRVLYGRINGFLFPQHHTVEITDLREPGLLESLRTLRELAADFQAAAVAGQ